MIDYHEMVKKVEKECGIKFRGYGRTDKQEDNCDGHYLDFWHLINETHDDIENPCEIELDLSKVLKVKRVFNKDLRLLMIESLGKIEGEKEIKIVQDGFDAVNCPLWKIDIIAAINNTYPGLIKDMKIAVHIDW